MDPSTMKELVAQRQDEIHLTAATAWLVRKRRAERRGTARSRAVSPSATVVYGWRDRWARLVRRWAAA